MEETSNVVVQETHTYSEAANIAMSIHLISERILPRLSFQDLLRCSVVSSNWNRHIRQYLREKKVCVASIRRPVTCKELVKFSDLVSDATNLPFNGLSIEMTRSWHTCVECDPLKIYHALTKKIPLKNLRIIWPKIINCPTEKVINFIQCNSFTFIVSSPFIYQPSNHSQRHGPNKACSQGFLPQVQVVHAIPLTPSAYLYCNLFPRSGDFYTENVIPSENLQFYMCDTSRYT